MKAAAPLSAVASTANSAPSSVVAPRLTTMRAPLLMRRCACGGTVGASGECDSCRQRRLLQRDKAGNRDVGAVPSSVHQTLSQAGKPLDTATRTLMEPRFGRDFSQVRIHDGAQAARSAKDVDAHAYTVGQDIVFAPGKYSPETKEGRELLAHELAHTVQQRGLQRFSTGVALAQGPENIRLEREADAAAAHVTNTAAPLSLPLSAAPSTILSKKAATPGKKKPNKTKKLAVTAGSLPTVTPSVTTKDSFKNEVAGSADNGKLLKQFEVDELALPASKGPLAKPYYDALASAHALKSTLTMTGTGRTKTALWQDRANTNELRDRWLQRVGWKSDAAHELWQLAGGDSEFPKVGSATCQMDHIVELQINGNNTNENIQPLDASQNGDSGRSIQQQLQQIAQQITENDDLDAADSNQVELVFKRVVLKGKAETLPAGKPTKPTCLSVANYASKMKVKDKTKLADDTGTKPYTLAAGGPKTELKVPLKFPNPGKGKASESVKILEDAGNKASAELIPGILLTELHGGTTHTVKGIIDDRGKTRLPITISDKRKDHVSFDVNATTGELKFHAGAGKGLKFTYPYLSPGEITKLSLDDPKNLFFEGWIQTKIPLIGRIDVRYAEGKFELAKAIDPKELKAPMPGLKVTKAELVLQLWPTFKPSGNVAMLLGSKEKPLMEVNVEAGLEGGKFTFNGDLKAFLPGVDDASGKIKYTSGDDGQPGVWSGGAKVTASQLKSKFKYISGGEASVNFGAKGLEASGELTAAVPHARDVKLGLEYKNQQWIFKGKGTFMPPKMKEIGVDVSYSSKGLVADVKPGPSFEVLGFKGGLDHLHYENEKFTGTGSVEIKKGKEGQSGHIHGKIILNLLPSGVFSGEGKITVVLKEGIEASAGAKLDEKQKLVLTGELRVTKPVKLFPKFEVSKEIFNISKIFPIPGLSVPGIGGVGVEIGGALSGSAGIGEGVLKDIFIRGEFAPLEADPEATLQAGAKLHIPAYIEIKGSILAGVAVDVLVAGISAGLKFGAGGRLEGSFDMDLQMGYTKGVYSVSTELSLSLSLIFLMSLDAYVRAKLGVMSLSKSWEWTWNLAKTELPTGLKLGVSAPIKYSSDKGFELPSLDTLKFTKPDVDFQNLAERMFNLSKKTDK